MSDFDMKIMVVLHDSMEEMICYGENIHGEERF